MKNLLANLAVLGLCLLALLVCKDLSARGSFGGGRSSSGGRSFSSGRSSSFGGSRSYSSSPSRPSSPSRSVQSNRSSGGSYFGGNRSNGNNTTITKPSKEAPSPRVGSNGPNTTIINNGGYGGGGFWSGYMWGSLMHPYPVYIYPGQAGYAGDGMGPMVVQQYGFGYYFFRVIILIVAVSLIGLFIFYLIRRVD